MAAETAAVCSAFRWCWVHGPEQPKSHHKLFLHQALHQQRCFSKISVLPASAGCQGENLEQGLTTSNQAEYLISKPAENRRFNVFQVFLQKKGALVLLSWPKRTTKNYRGKLTTGTDFQTSW